MDFSWTEDQQSLKQAVIEFAQAELNQDLIGRDHRSEFPWDSWRKCAAFGLPALPFPEAYGGAEADLLTTMLAMEGLGYACRDNGLLFSLHAHIWPVARPLLDFGSEEQKDRYLPLLCRGEWIGAYALTEPGAGSDAFSLQMRAEKQGDHYLLNGTKTFVTNAPVADLVLVFATLNPARGIAGVTAFLVEKGFPGYSVSREIEKMGLRTSPMGEIILENCVVPEGNRLGREGGGLAIFNGSIEWERSCILATHLGAMERQLEECVRYARQRQQFHQSIGKFQSVSNRLADMKVRLETARLLLYKVAWLNHTGQKAFTEAAMAKLYISEAFVQSSLDAVRIHGGYGYTTEFEVERDLRDAVGGVLYSGTSDIQRMIIARSLGL